MAIRRREHRYFVCIMSSETRVLHIGVTSNVEQRVQQHKEGAGSAFSAKYRTRKLVYFEETSDVHDALEREHHLKGWKRARKVALIKAANPEWLDLSAEWLNTSADRL
jgi:putative endonuclease